jgi:hypothetical protein
MMTKQNWKVKLLLSWQLMNIEAELKKVLDLNAKALICMKYESK